jgi:hypothetical protein
MRRFAVILCLVLCSLPYNGFAQAEIPTVYVSAETGFQTAITAAFIKKHVAATVLTQADKAQYTLQAAPVDSKEESTGGKVARCLFADCIGINGYSEVSVELIRNRDGAVVWAYQVRKGNSGPLGIQSLSEAIAKHLQHDYLEKHKPE